jgi:hypothetical protein
MSDLANSIFALIEDKTENLTTEELISLYEELAEELKTRAEMYQEESEN